jgi:hypothetical protein
VTNKILNVENMINKYISKVYNNKELSKEQSQAIDFAFRAGLTSMLVVFNTLIDANVDYEDCDAVLLGIERQLIDHAEEQLRLSKRKVEEN